MSTVGDVLSQAGVRVSEAEFARLVEDALREIGPGADDPRAALAPSDVAALVEVAADLRPRRRNEADPRAAAAATTAAVLADTLSVGEVAARLGIDASRVRHRLAARTLVGFRRTGGWRLPTWQFGPDGQPLPGLPRVLRALAPQTHPTVLAHFFATPQPELTVGRRVVSPRDWLAGGGDPSVPESLAASLALLP
jgi:hypothetical protein